MCLGPFREKRVSRHVAWEVLLPRSPTAAHAACSRVSDVTQATPGGTVTAFSGSERKGAGTLTELSREHHCYITALWL